ncbi:hypothetical protein T08_8913 [Trichinella sp. T8]|nr:hypothetical protein T08_8913 [Trichinella sp. T8]
MQTFRGYRLFVLKNIGENVFSKLFLLTKDSVLVNLSGNCDPLSDKEKSGRNFLDFHHLPGRLNQPRTKLYCSGISKKLFPDYYDRRTTERICSNVYIHSGVSIDIDLSSISNLRKPVLNATCAVSVFYANWAGFSPFTWSPQPAQSEAILQ